MSNNKTTKIEKYKNGVTLCNIGKKMVRGKIFLVFFILVTFIFLILQVSAYDYVFEEDTSINITLPVFMSDNSKADTSVSCFMSVLKPVTGELIENDSVMTYNPNGLFNISLNSSLVNSAGEYDLSVRCDNSSDYSFLRFSLLVTPTGIEPSEQRTEAVSRSIWFIGTLALTFFIISFFIKNSSVKWTFIILSFLFFMVSLNTIVVGMRDEVVNTNLINFFDVFEAASFYIFWFAGSLLIILWGYTIINTILIKKTQKDMARFGA